MKWDCFKTCAMLSLSGLVLGIAIRHPDDSALAVLSLWTLILVGVAFIDDGDRDEQTRLPEFGEGDSK